MQKIAILGGGVGALTTAFELTNDPGWKDKYEITFYQMGWRLGGKGASGRNRQMYDRVQEHGIHLWMGFYENAFHMIRKAYEEANQKNLMPASPFKSARDAFSPMNYTPMMEQMKDGSWKVWNINWTPPDAAGRNEFPGEDSLFAQEALPPTPGEFVAMMLRDTTALLNEHKERHPALLALYREAMEHLADAVGGWNPGLHEHHEPEGKHTLLERVAIFFGKAAAYVVVHSPEVHKLIGQALRKFNQWLFDLVQGELEKNDELRHVVIIVDTAIAAIIGILEDDVLAKGFMAIEDKDFIQWLKDHGCNYADSPLTRGMYDACFGYMNGEPDKMSMGAGSTLYGSLRLIFTYRGALMWWMNAGMGETIMSPLYLALKSRGVKFNFFHKVKNLGLADDKKSVATIDLEIQATPNGEYDPLFTGVDGVPCWPTEPFWEQLKEGAEIQKCKNPDLESWWTDWHGRSAMLTKGQDFDLVVLGVSLGPLPYISQELITASQPWRDMVSNVKLVRTQALQLWLNKTLPEVGWKPNVNWPTDKDWTGRGILCGYSEPFDTWSDMAQILPRETWPPALDVKQVAYFCNVIPDDPLKGFDQTSYPAEELDRVKKYSRAFLDGSLLGIWPAAALDPKSPTNFNDSVLVNCANDPKQSTFDTQFFRVNIDPSELYVLSVPGSAKYRLKSGESGFENLYLAGDWTLTDINIGCIEAAVISGCMASRAICGKPAHIYGAFGSMIPIGKGAGAK